MYSSAASLNSVTEHGATAFSSWQTLRVLTEFVSLCNQAVLINGLPYRPSIF